MNDALARALAGFTPHAPALPAVRRTPAPERSKVMAAPVRAPINRAAALIISPVRSWVCQPPPMPPEKLNTPERRELARLTAELKSERNDHAATRDALGLLRQQWMEQKRQCLRLTAKIQEQDRIIREKESLIAQLEDLRL